MDNAQLLTILGIFLLFISISLIILGNFMKGDSSNNQDSNFSFGGFIGPIPFGFANTPIGWAIGAVIFVLMVLVPVLIHYFR